LGRDVVFGEVKEDSILNEVLFGPLMSSGRRLGNLFSIGKESEGSGLEVSSHLKIYFIKIGLEK
jgi:hypothetical protein